MNKKSKSSVAQKKQKITLSDEGKKEFQKALCIVWDVIGNDVIRCTAESEERNINSVMLPRDVVIETCLDADYLITYNPNLSQEVKDFYRNGNYNDMIKLAEDVFRFKFYGM